MHGKDRDLAATWNQQVKAAQERGYNDSLSGWLARENGAPGGALLSDPARHGAPWSSEEERVMIAHIANHRPIDHVAKELCRKPSAIISRLQLLCVLDRDNYHAVDPSRPLFGEDLKRAQEMHLSGRTHAKNFLPATKETTVSDNTRLLNLVALLQEGYTTITARFGTSAKDYTYRAPLSMALAVGDKVVVDAPSGLSVVTVSAVHEAPEIDVNSPFNIKWVVSKVDMTTYNEQTRREAAAVVEMQTAQRKKASAEARAELQERYGVSATVLAILAGETEGEKK
jgi:hypothetical protein